MLSKNKILEDFERYAYIIELLVDENYILSVAEVDDYQKLKLKYKFLR